MGPWGYHCVTGDGFIAVDEYTTGFKWWDWNSRCVAFGRDSWTFGKASIYDEVCKYGDVIFCQTNQDTHNDPCGKELTSSFPGRTTLCKRRLSDGIVFPTKYTIIPFCRSSIGKVRRQTGLMTIGPL